MSPCYKTPEYTEEERSTLWEYVVKAHAAVMEERHARGEIAGLLGMSSGFGPNKCDLDDPCVPETVQQTLGRPLEDMPLLINDLEPYTRATAIWRLSIGR